MLKTAERIPVEVNQRAGKTPIKVRSWSSGQVIKDSFTRRGNNFFEHQDLGSGWTQEPLETVVIFFHSILCKSRVVLVAPPGDLREIRAIEGTTANDFLVWCLCPLCALAQESQEIKAISQGNVVKHSVPLFKAMREARI